jgi:RNA polymerase sigma factor (TIGR02999 family)
VVAKKGLMSDVPSDDVTQLLEAWQAGDDHALDEVMSLVYGELRRLADRYLRRERAGHTFEAHDLIHEAFLRLVGQRQVDWRNRAHFFGIAAQSMRRVLVDHARRRNANRRSGEVRHLVPADEAELAVKTDVDLLALDEALTDLATADEALARVVELRYFGGFDHDEIAELLGVSNPTVRRRWRLAKAWLFRRLSASGSPPDGG